MLENHPRFDVVDALHVREFSANAGIGQIASLANALKLQIRLKVGKGIAAGVIVVAITAHPSPHGEHGIVREEASE